MLEKTVEEVEKEKEIVSLEVYIAPYQIPELFIIGDKIDQGRLKSKRKEEERTTGQEIGKINLFLAQEELYRGTNTKFMEKTLISSREETTRDLLDYIKRNIFEERANRLFQEGFANLEIAKGLLDLEQYKEGYHSYMEKTIDSLIRLKIDFDREIVVPDNPSTNTQEAITRNIIEGIEAKNQQLRNYLYECEYLQKRDGQDSTLPNLHSSTLSGKAGSIYFFNLSRLLENIGHFGYFKRALPSDISIGMESGCPSSYFLSRSFLGYGGFNPTHPFAASCCAPILLKVKTPRENEANARRFIDEIKMKYESRLFRKNENGKLEKEFPLTDQIAKL